MEHVTTLVRVFLLPCVGPIPLVGYVNCEELLTVLELYFVHVEQVSVTGIPL